MDLITGSLPETVVILSIENKIKYANKSFNKLFDFIDEEIFVHRITCNGKKGFDRKVMYPFITQNNSKKGYYVFEGAIYILEY